MIVSVRRVLATALLAGATALALLPAAPANAERHNTRPLFAGATVNDKAPTTSSWGTTGVIGAGYYATTRKRVRSYLQFHTGVLKGKRIISAELNILQIKAASCQPHITRLYATSPISRATTWKKQPTRYPNASANSSVAGCRGDRDWVGFDVTDGIARAARANANSASFLLAAANETDARSWKQFDRSTATVSVTYVSTPAVPSAVTILTASSSRACGTAEKPTAIAATSVRIRAMIATPDGSSSNLNAIWRRSDVTAGVDLPLAKTDAFDGSPSELGWKVEDGHTYRFEVRSRSNYQNSAGAAKYVESQWTQPCYFAIDVTPPAAPVLTSQDYAECTDVTCPVQGTAGVPGTFQITLLDPEARHAFRIVTDPDDPEEGFEMWWDPQPNEFVVMPSAGVNYLQAYAQDRAGNRSAVVQFKFQVNPRP